MSLIGFVFLFAFAMFSRVIAESSIKWLVLVWAVITILFNLAFEIPLEKMIVGIIIIMPLMYIWLRLLHRFQDTIGTYLFILIGGGLLLGFI